MNTGIRNKFFWSILFTLLISLPAYAQDEFPEPVGYVNDFAGVIRPEIKRSLQRLILELKNKTGAEIAVVTVKTVGENYTVTEYANLLFEKWQIGEKGKDNGILVLNAIDDRYIWIEVGYGLEGILPDGLVGEIRDRYFMPYLKRGDYGNAYLAGVAALAGVIAKDAGVKIDGSIPVSTPPPRKRRSRGYGGILTLLILFFFLSRLGRRRSGFFWGPWTFGGFGGGFGGGGSFGGGFGGGFGGFGGGASGGGGAGGSY